MNGNIDKSTGRQAGGVIAHKLDLLLLNSVQTINEKLQQQELTYTRGGELKCQMVAVKLG